MDYLVDINLKGNELKELKVENLAVDPTGYVGRLYYNTASNKYRYHTGSAWVDVSADMAVLTDQATETGQAVYNMNGTVQETLTLAAATGSGRRVIVAANTLSGGGGGLDFEIGEYENTNSGGITVSKNASWVTIQAGINLSGANGYNATDVSFSHGGAEGPGTLTIDFRLINDDTGEAHVEALGIFDNGSEVELTPSVYPNGPIDGSETYSIQVNAHGEDFTFYRHDSDEYTPSGTIEAQCYMNFDQPSTPSKVGVIADGTDTINGTATLDLFETVTVELVDSSSGKWVATPHKLTYNKTDVGLPNVDNTTDINKPISSATQTVLTDHNARILALESATTADYVRYSDRLVTLPAPPNDTESAGSGRIFYTTIDNKAYRYDVATTSYKQLNPDYEETVASSTVWTIDHGLGKHPAVTCRNGAGAEIIGQIVHTSNTQVVITYNTAIAGSVSCT